MAILRGCARCGGDVLTGDRRNVRCLQCGHRPDAPIAEIRRRARGDGGRGVEGPVDVEAFLAALGVAEDAAGDDVADDDVAGVDAESEARCPRCDDVDAIALEKLRAEFNTCYRCRLCGHIFSPGGWPGGSTAGLREAS